MGTLVTVILIGLYGGGAWRFWAGFDRTNFSHSKVPLTLLWPVLLVVNKAYRENFSRALKG